ncbi:hypothetical protein HY495_00195 [Candidatus Woesearchaeota archaeon]|nr:hypothetical protein [Candidatus Woesearchaeota archaeon]
MKCKICDKQAKGLVCKTCQDFLAWLYPGKDPEDVLERYKAEYVKNCYARRRKK